MSIKKTLGRIVRDAGVIGALAALWYFFNDGVSHWQLSAKIDREAGAINAKVETVDGKVEVVDGKVDVVDGKLNEVYSKMDSMDAKLDRIEGKLDQILDIANRPVIDLEP